ncbi:MAG: hypothetical protein V4495_13595 [Pseudomonadota bacterium]
MSLNISPDRQQKQKWHASHGILLSLILGLILPLHVHGQQTNDLTQMDSVNTGKAAANQQKKESTLGLASKLSAADAKKYQAVIASMEGKNGDEILKSMQADNAARLAKMPPERRKQVEEYQKKYLPQIANAGAGSQYQSLDATMEKFRLHLLGLDRGDGKVMSAQQRQYFEHREAQIRQKYFDPVGYQKNRRMREDADAYIKANLDIQAEYAKKFANAPGNAPQTQSAPLPDVLRSNWLVRKMATEEPAALMPKASTMLPGSAAIARAQIDDLSRQLRSNKTVSVTERYGASARVISEAEARSKLQEPGRNGNPAANTNNVPVTGTTGASKAQTEAPARKASPIPGL